MLASIFKLLCMEPDNRKWVVKNGGIRTLLALRSGDTGYWDTGKNIHVCMFQFIFRHNNVFLKQENILTVVRMHFCYKTVGVRMLRGFEERLAEGLKRTRSKRSLRSASSASRTLRALEVFEGGL